MQEEYVHLTRANTKHKRQQSPELNYDSLDKSSDNSEDDDLDQAKPIPQKHNSSSEPDKKGGRKKKQKKTPAEQKIDKAKSHKHIITHNCLYKALTSGTYKHHCAYPVLDPQFIAIRDKDTLYDQIPVQMHYSRDIKLID